MVEPMVSVVIPAYNAARWLGETVQSVLAGTYQDFEVIVVDDGSTDGTRQVVENFGDGRIRCIYQANRGLSGARNTGIRAARGRYVALLDADDLFRPEKLARQVARLEEDAGLGLVTCGFDLIDEQGRWLREERPWLHMPHIDLRALLFWNPLLPSTLLLRRVWFDQVGLFDESMRRYEDWEIAVRLALAGCRMDYVREPLLAYRRHGSNMSTAAELVSVATQAATAFMTRFFEHPDLPTDIMALRGRVFGSLYLDAAARAYGAGLGPSGREWLASAIDYDPDLLTPQPPRWVVSLCGHALGTLVEDWRAYIRTVAAHLPPGPAFQEWTERRLVAQVYSAQTFKLHAMRQRTRARLAAWQALALDPTLLTNRGLVALGLRPW